MSRMPSKICPVRFPVDFDATTEKLEEQQGQNRSQLIRGALLQVYQSYYVQEIGWARYGELCKSVLQLSEEEHESK